MPALDITRMADRPLLVSLTPEQIANFFAAGKIMEFAPGEMIIRENTVGDSLFMILDGRVIISLDAHTSLAVLSGEDTLLSQYEGDFFGEMSILDHEPRAATVKAIGATRVFRIEREALNKLFAQDINFQVVLLMNMSRILSRRFRHLMHNPVNAPTST